MRILVTLLLAFATAASAETLPERRPALFGSGPDSLVNLIDAAGLMQQGQRDAWVMFDCVIGEDGTAGRVVQYRVSPGARLLRVGISRALKRARFIPAVYKHRRTDAAIRATVIFVVQNGRPRLRVYANQEMDELRRGSDLIAPQMVKRAPSPFPRHAANLRLSSTVKIRHAVDAQGKTTRVEVVSDTMPGEGFGEAASSVIEQSEFLPAYRDGRPVASVTTFDFRYYGRHGF